MVRIFCVQQTTNKLLVLLIIKSKITVINIVFTKMQTFKMLTLFMFLVGLISRDREMWENFEKSAKSLGGSNKRVRLSAFRNFGKKPYNWTHKTIQISENDGRAYSNFLYKNLLTISMASKQNYGIIFNLRLNGKRIPDSVTLSSGSRKFYLVKRDKSQKLVKNVILLFEDCPQDWDIKCLWHEKVLRRSRLYICRYNDLKKLPAVPKLQQTLTFKNFSKKSLN